MDPARMFKGELDLTPGIREQSGSFSDLDAFDWDVRSAPDRGTEVGHPATSERCQTRTWKRYSITSSARC